MPSATVLPRRRARTRLSGAAQVGVLTAGVAVLAAVTWVAVARLPPPDGGALLPWWALAAAFALTERGGVHLHFRRSAYTLTLGELPLIAGLLLAAPAAVAPAWVLGVAVVLAAERVPALRIAFNAAQLALTAGAAVLVFTVLHGGAGVAEPVTWAAAACAVIVAALGSAALTAAAMALAGERVPLARLRAMLTTAAAVAVTNTSLGLALAVVVSATPVAGVLLLGPALAVLLTYRALERERTRTAGLSFLYDAAQTLTRAHETSSGVAGLLGLTLETFRAERAEVVVFGESGEDAPTRIVVGPDGRPSVGATIAPAAADALAERLRRGGGEAVVVRVADVAGPLGTHLRDAGLREAMLAALPGDRGPLGAIVAGNRLGAAEPFGADDLRLFGTLAAHAGAALARDRLARHVHELRESQEDLYHRAFHDELTGLANRPLFQDRLGNAMARRTGNVAVIYIDLDRFKPINDTYGHEAGDRLLQAVGDRLRASLRPADTPARLGGDEFAVLLVDIARDDAETVARRIHDALAEPCDVGGAEVPILASIGLAVRDSGTATADEVLREADAAMFVRKRARGR